MTTRDQQVVKRDDIDKRLASVMSHTREMRTCFKKMSVINDSSGSDSVAIVPSTLMQVMTLERFAFVHLHWICFCCCCSFTVCKQGFALMGHKTNGLQ